MGIVIGKSLADLGGAPGARPPPPTGPDSFVLTCKIFENVAAWGVHGPLRGPRPPTGNPGSATANNAQYLNN